MKNEAEDYNAFNCWDCLGAVFLLGLVPAVINFVFNDHDIFSTVVIVLIAAVISVVVFLLAMITRWPIIGKIVNLAGCVLSLFYIAVALHMCQQKIEEKEAQKQELLKKATQPKA